MATITGTNKKDKLIGTAFADSIFGLGGNDTLLGKVGNDLLYGGLGNDTLDGGKGKDKMYGGKGDDTYVVDNASDKVIEKAGQGHDLVKSSISHTLAANVEDLTLTGVAAINGTGNAADNIITGNDGNNILDGGAGTDHMFGGAGDDTYVVDNAGDTESDTSGTDTVLSSVTHALGSGVENLTLTGAAAINGTGNELDNTITGNGANNILDGGLGADHMFGGARDDTYIVDNAGDTESDTSGTDTVLSSVTHALGSGVENLTLTGSAASNGTGNALDNTITGNGAANSLSGGDGNDKLFGGDGDDVLQPGAGSDIVDGGAGSDLLSYADAAASVFVTLRSDHTVTVSGTATGDIASNIEGLIGSGFGDNLNIGTVGPPGATFFAYGGDGNDQISDHAQNPRGGSVAGLFVLRGDGGNDTLIGGRTVDLPLNTDHFWLQYDRGIDTVVAFQASQDKYLISASEFHLPAGLQGFSLPTELFLSSTTSLAQTATQRFIYETDTQILWADLDGNGSQFNSQPVADLHLVSGPSLSDFLIIA